MLHRFVAVPIAVLACLVVASVALAGGWAQVSATGGPIDPVAGEETPIELEVLQHGTAAVSWPRLNVVATDAVTGAVVRAEAEPRGPEGAYVATMVFPTEGQWTLTFESNDLIMEGSVALSVAPAVAAAATGASAVVAPTIDVMALIVVALAALVAVTTAGMVLKGRGSAAGAQVSART
jgi:hypothetical protein